MWTCVTSTNMNEGPDAETSFAEMESTTIYSQVVFIDVPRSYTPNTNVTCSYTLTAGLQPNPRDWIGVFKVGWNTTQNYHNYVWVEPCLDRLGPDPVRRQVVFDAYYLPKDDGDYQFCYVDSNGQVRGASTPFSFESTQDHALYTSLESDILVISTKEQTEEMEKERGKLRQEVEQFKEDNQILKNQLHEKLKEINHLKLTIEEMKSTISTHTEVPDGESMCHEEDGVSDFKQSQESLVQSQAPIEEKYETALQKINQLKQKRKDLIATTEKKQTEITHLNSKVTEMEQDLSRLQDNVQLLQVDLQSSQKENKKLCAEAQLLGALKRDLEELRKENEVLRSSQIPQSEDESNAQVLLSQLHDTRVQLQQELQRGNEARKHADAAKLELGEIRALLEQKSSGNKPQMQDSSLEVKLKEAQRTIDDQAAIMDLAKLEQEDLETKLKKALKTIDDQGIIIDLAKEEQEDLAKKNQELQTGIDLLKGELALVKPGTGAGPDLTPHSFSSFPSVPDATTDSQDSSLIFGNPYEYPESASDTVKVPQCQHCLTIFPGISREELTQHEDSHKVCPICTLICDEMDQQQFEDHVYTHDL